MPGGKLWHVTGKFHSGGKSKGNTEMGCNSYSITKIKIKSWKAILLVGITAIKNCHNYKMSHLLAANDGATATEYKVVSIEVKTEENLSSIW